MTDAIYTARSHAVGGREGTAKTDDGHLDVKLGYPKSMGGNGEGTNPEQLFAAGYGACFLGALGVVARSAKASSWASTASTSRSTCSRRTPPASTSAPA
jgi:Ohr subfamily peroxiredoxin